MAEGLFGRPWVLGGGLRGGLGGCCHTLVECFEGHRAIKYIFVNTNIISRARVMYRLRSASARAPPGKAAYPPLLSSRSSPSVPGEPEG